MRDAIACVHELGVLYGRSSKYRAVFREVATSGEGSFTTLKPLCPTRWLCRSPALQSVIDQYEAVIESLSDTSQSSNGDIAAKANGLLDKFQQGQTLLLLNTALIILSILEHLNRSLQSKSITVSGMIKAIGVVKTELASMRTEETFSNMFCSSSAASGRLQLNDIELPRRRRPPARYTGAADAYSPSTAEEHYRTL